MSPDAHRRRDKQSLDYILRSGLAGGVAGCVAKTAVAPLDRVKILFQASNPDFVKYAGTWSGVFKAGRQIYHDNGLRGLLQGHSATLLRIFPYAAIKFMAYDQFHYLLMPTRAQETNTRRFIAGALAGTTSVFFTYPLEVIRVRMAFHNKQPSSFRNAFWHILSESTHPHSTTTIPATLSIFDRLPLLKFYRGFTVTITGMVPYAGVSFLSYGYLRNIMLPDGQKPTSPIPDLTCGAVAGLLGQTSSYPFEIVRRRMQVGGITRPDRWLRWGETIRAVYSANGWRGFYVGLSIGYLKVVPMTAISFAAWQGGKRLLNV